MNSVLAESQNFIVTNEYEKVYINFKTCNRKIYIGDFYGDPSDAAISYDESFCVMAGCGLIIYYLHEPFEEYMYNTSTSQWKELFRQNGREWWIKDVEIIDDSTIMFTAEITDTQDDNRFTLDLDSYQLI